MTTSRKSSGKWITLLLYGAALGLLLAALQFFQYRLIVLKNAEQWYIGLIALLFTAVGIWAGGKWTQKKEPISLPTESVVQEVLLLPPKQIAEKHNFTLRELEVLELIAQGLSNQEIADQLFVSLNTVKTHTSKVFAKLDAQRRTQAIQKAKALGLLS